MIFSRFPARFLGGARRRETPPLVVKTDLCDENRTCHNRGRGHYCCDHTPPARSTSGCEAENGRSNASSPVAKTRR